jgi:signal peptidase II
VKEPTVDEPVPDAATEPSSGDASSSEVAVADPPRKLRLVVTVAIVVIVLDQLTKTWALRALADGPIESIGSLQFQLFFNTGAAFSMGSGRGLGPWVTVLAIVVVVGLSLGYNSRFTLGAASAGLIAGGAIGNLADRAFRGDDGFLHGAVVDFIDLQWWPVFNIADACIVVGAVLLVLSSFRNPAGE